MNLWYLKRHNYIWIDGNVCENLKNQDFRDALRYLRVRYRVQKIENKFFP